MKKNANLIPSALMADVYRKEKSMDKKARGQAGRREMHVGGGGVGIGVSYRT